MFDELEQLALQSLKDSLEKRVTVLEALQILQMLGQLRGDFKNPDQQKKDMLDLANELLGIASDRVKASD